MKNGTYITHYDERFTNFTIRELETDNNVFKLRKYIKIGVRNTGNIHRFVYRDLDIVFEFNTGTELMEHLSKVFEDDYIRLIKENDSVLSPADLTLKRNYRSYIKDVKEKRPN